MNQPPLVKAPCPVLGSCQPHQAAPLIGRVISDRYRIDELIARGGMGVVYRGYHLYLKKQVAVKVLHADMDDLPGIVARFEREAIAGAHVSHPNVAAATDFGKLADGSFFLVVEHVAGVSLADVLRRGPMQPTRAVRVARQLAAALAAMHATGVVHRDMKARNVMLDEQGGDVAKIIDFGLARVQLDRPSGAGQRRERITRVGEVFGTVAYLAPEASLGMDAVDGRADLYALGVILYEMLAGRRPFAVTDVGELFLAQLDAPPSLVALAPHVSPELEAVVMRLLARDPAERFQTGDEVVAALDGASSSAMDSAAPAVLSRRSEAPRRARVATFHAALFAALAVVAMLIHARPVPPTRVASAAMALTAALPVVAPAALELTLDDAALLSSEPAARERLVHRARRHDYSGAAQALTALIAGEPRALRDAEVGASARDVAASLGPGRLADEVFDALAQRAGSAGVDVLYAVVEARGGSRGFARAAEELRKPEVQGRGSPEVRVAFALRDVACESKPALFEQAVRDGDGRALLALETAGRLCFPRSGALDVAITRLRARLVRR